MANTYVVKSGDTLSAIGAKAGVDWRKITGFRSGNPNLIFPGEVLTLPGGSPAAKPKTKAQVQPFLTKKQTATAKKGALPTVRTEEEISESLAEKGLESVELGDRPEVPSLKDEFQELREEQGVEALELRLNELRGAEDEVIATLRQRKAAARGERVAIGVIEGRIGEVERQERENLDFIQRQKSRVVEELEQKYSVISMMMELTQQDYTNALNDYNSKFKQNLDMINLVRGIRQDEKDEVEQAKDNARANFQIYANLAVEGKVNFNTMSATQKINIAKIEVASGFEVGFLASIKQPPTQEIIATNTLSNGQTQLTFRDRNTGAITTKRYGTPIAPKAPGGGGGTKAQKSTTQWRDTAYADINKGGERGYTDKYGRWQSSFAVFVDAYAPYLSLQELYALYNKSIFGRKYGAPTDKRSDINKIYDNARG